MLRGADQLQYLQHLLYLLPPCNCDTLLRLLTLLHTVQSFAQDSIGTNDEEVGQRHHGKCRILKNVQLTLSTTAIEKKVKNDLKFTKNEAFALKRFCQKQKMCALYRN